MTDTMTRPVVAPLEEVTPIRHSEAIRLGCLIAPVQAFEDYYDRETGSACAGTALFLGLGMKQPVSEAINFRGYPVQCPVGGTIHCPTPDEMLALEHLNDDHRWSREQIADWLEGLGL